MFIFDGSRKNSLFVIGKKANYYHMALSLMFLGIDFPIAMTQLILNQVLPGSSIGNCLAKD